MSFLRTSKPNERKALVKVLEIDSNNDLVKNELGFGVKLGKNKETNQYMFITSSSVLKNPLCIGEGSKLVAERYCSKYPNHLGQEDHREELYEVTCSSKDDRVSFVFYKGSSDIGFLEIDNGMILKTLPIRQTLLAYAFEGKDLVELTFQDKYSNNDYKLANVSKKDFLVTKAKGAPVIAFYLNEIPYVVGVLDTNSDGTLYPVFVTPDKLKVHSGPKRQPESNDEKNILNPNGGQQEADTTDEKDSPSTNDAKNGTTEGNMNDEKDSPITNDVEIGKLDAIGTDETGSTIHRHPSNTEGTKEILVVTGSQNQNVRAREIKKENISPIVFQEETKCFKYKTINEALPHTLKIKLQIKLDPPRPLGGDIGSLAEEYGYTLEEITYLKNVQFPTQTLLQQKGDSTLLFLRNKLEKIEREGAAKLIDDHIKHNCDCEECGSLR